MKENPYLGFSFLCLKFQKKRGGYKVSYIQEIMDRANLQQLREFLLTGVENIENQSFDYEERLHNAYSSFAILAKEHGIKEDSILQDALTFYISECEIVFVELGIIGGFSLCKEIFEKGTKLTKL